MLDAPDASTSHGRFSLRARAWVAAEVAVFYAGFFLVQEIVAAVTPRSWRPDGSLDPWAGLLFFALVAAITTAWIALLQKLRGDTLEDLGLRVPVRRWRFTVPFGIAAGLLILLIRSPLDALLGWLRLESTADGIFRVESGGDWLAFCLMGIVAGGYLEELKYRGYLLSRFEALFARRDKPERATLAAVLATAALFGAFHAYQGSLGIASVAITGLFLGALYLLCRRTLAPVMIAHAAIDVAVFTWMWRDAP